MDKCSEESRQHRIGWRTGEGRRKFSAQMLYAGTVLGLCEDMDRTKCEIAPLLEHAGYLVKVVEAEVHALRTLLDANPEIVLLDIQEPEGIGFQLCSQIRNLSQMPIMVVLRDAARYEVLRVFEAGADSYVLAPVQPREFLARVGALLRRRPAQVRPGDPLGRRALQDLTKGLQR